MLVGRKAESARIDALLARARAGESGILVIRGEPGIGKTALLERAREQASGMTVLSAAGVESESELPFSGLYELLRPILEELASIPPPQADALGGALALRREAATDRFAVYAATLSLLAAAAERRPLVALVDDAHWLDSGSMQALAFTARRLRAEEVALLFAVREGERGASDLVGLPELVLDGLHGEAAAAIVERSVGRSLPRGVVAGLQSATGGNPLGLLELPRRLTPEQLSGDAPLEEPLPVGREVGRAFGRRIDLLPESTRAALVVAAASESGELAEIGAALARSGRSPADFEPAEAEQLVRLDRERLLFVHPLVRAAVYHRALPAERRAAHRALAEALAASDQETRRAWHLAAAAIGPDEEAAAALERAGRIAHERTAYAAAAAALARAAELTQQRERLGGRLYEAGEAAWLGGRAGQALDLLERAADASTEDALLTVEIAHLRGRVTARCGAPMAAQSILVEAADQIEAADARRAAALLVEAARALDLAGALASALDVAEHAWALARGSGGSQEFLAAFELARVLYHIGKEEAARELLEHAVALAPGGDLLKLDPDFVVVGSGELPAPAGNRDTLGEAIARLRERAAIGTLPTLLRRRADADFWAGRWTSAYADVTEALALAEETGEVAERAMSLAVLAWMDAVRGREAECRAHAGEALELADRLAHISTRAHALYALGELETALGRTDEAIARYEDYGRLLAAHGFRHADALALPELVEAYVWAGRAKEAAELTERYAALVEGTRIAATRAILAECQGLVADDATYAGHFEHALECWRDAGDPTFQRARTQLCYGERLRRNGRRTEARRPLAAAHNVFGQLGATPWVERARNELAATGARARRRDPTVAEKLTPQELHVALAVAEGRTNKEVAAALFLTPKTVEYHLRNIFRKLDIRSRTQLARRFAQAEGEFLVTDLVDQPEGVPRRSGRPAPR